MHNYSITSAKNRSWGKLYFGLLTIILLYWQTTVSQATGYLGLEERVVLQTKIEEIKWSHQIWPKDNPTRKPAREEIISDSDIRKKVESWLEKEAVLYQSYGVEITNAGLQAELSRIASSTRAPERLQELFNILGNDPYIIAEILVKPLLVKRLYDNLIHQAHSPDIMVNHSTPSRQKSKFQAAEADRVESLYLPQISSNAKALVKKVDEIIPADTWADIYPLPVPTSSYTAVWTGTEVIIWGGNYDRSGGISPPYEYVNIGARYNPVTNVWTSTSQIEAPTGRKNHKAVWTGTEMIVWGGYVYEDGVGAVETNTGGRYSPVTDSWTEMNTATAPDARWGHFTVWTGTEMIVWGGLNLRDNLQSGGRYNPDTDNWTTMSETDAPAGRTGGTAIWTGTEIIVWGGAYFEPIPAWFKLNSGGRYNPATDSWTPISEVDAPGERDNHTAVWTGSEMIIFGGNNYGAYGTGTGGRYNPISDSWMSTTLYQAPSMRASHTAVWTGTEMIIWGGIVFGPSYGTSTDTGASFNPTTGLWTALTTDGAPTPQGGHVAFWVGTEMIVWGGNEVGGRYNPSGDQWSPISLLGDAPSAVSGNHSAVWTGSEMIVWGGGADSQFSSGGQDEGGRYDPATNSWQRTSTVSVPSGRRNHGAVWTGTEMIIWGGYGDYSNLNTGGRYNPMTDSWISVSTTAAPSGVEDPGTIWTGTEMIIWNGSSGGRYDPTSDTWISIDLTGAPSTYHGSSTIWTGSEMIVWGGNDLANNNTGGKYDPEEDSWTPTSTTGTPPGRYSHKAVWTGREMIVWGGQDSAGYYPPMGGVYNPATDTWRITSIVGVPNEERDEFSMIWTGQEVVIWGGYDQMLGYVNTGLRYDPAADSWQQTSLLGAPSGRGDHTAVWTGTEMIIWGGRWDPLGIYYPYDVIPIPVGAMLQGVFLLLLSQ